MSLVASEADDSDQPENLRKLYLKALSAKEVENYAYAKSLLESVLLAAPDFENASTLLKEVRNHLGD